MIISLSYPIKQRNQINTKEQELILKIKDASIVSIKWKNIAWDRNLATPGNANKRQTWTSVLTLIADRFVVLIVYRTNIKIISLLICSLYIDKIKLL